MIVRAWFLLGQFIDMGVDALFPLWAISSVASGGLDWDTDDVGQVRQDGRWHLDTNKF